MVSAIDFGTPADMYGAEIDKLRQICDDCFILKNWKMPNVIYANMNAERAKSWKQKL
jgi:hypothetical protein